WTSLASKNLRGYALKVVQDPKDPDLLFLGTELGLWVSLDGGKDWMQWKHGVPTVSVMDMIIQPREEDLVLATHVLAFFVVDDIRRRRERKEKEAREKAGAPPKEKTPVPAQAQGGKPLEETPPPGEQPAEDESGRKKDPQAKVEVLDESGAVIRSFDAPVKLGVNRAAWDLRSDAPKRIPRKRDDEGFSEFRGNRGPEVLPGTYTVRVSYAGQTAEGKVQVLGDPRFEVTREAREANLAAIRRTNKLVDVVADGVERIQRTRRDVDAVVAQLRRDQEAAKKQGGAADDPARKAVLDAARDLQSKLGSLEKRFWQTEDAKGLTEDKDLEQRVGYVARSLGSSW